MRRDRPDARDFFAGISQLEHPEYDVKLPIFYRDAAAMSAIYPASSAAVRSRLPSPDLHPVEVVPGRCLVAISAFEYRDTDIGPYNELSVAALVSFGRRSIPGVTAVADMLRHSFSAFILHLPVTSERARRGGVEMAGYPKYLVDIDFARAAGRTTCTLSAGGSRILVLDGANPATARGPIDRYRLYTVRGGVLLRANLFLDPLQRAQTLGRGAARLEVEGDHPLAADLGRLALGRWPLLYQYMPSYQAILCGSKNLVDD